MNIERNMRDVYRSRYPSGTRVRMVYCADAFSPIPVGEKGTVRMVDDMGTVHVDWDSGRKLGVILDQDSIEVISR